MIRLVKKKDSTAIILDAVQRIRENMLCPITLEQLANPVITADGQSYEEKAIADWLVLHDTSPTTGRILPHKDVIPNYQLKALIDALDNALPLMQDTMKEHYERCDAFEQRVLKAEAQLRLFSEPSNRTRDSRCTTSLSAQQTRASFAFFKKDGPSEPVSECLHALRQTPSQWVMAAQAGDVEAQALLGRAYLTGIGLKRNKAEAHRYLHLAKQSSSPPGFWAFGMCYEEGLGFVVNIQRAVAYYQRAAELGYAPAQVSLGRCYMKGVGVPAQDIGRGLALYQHASAQGCVYAHVALALAYQQGKGTHQQASEAIELYRLAMDQGHVGALYYLGLSFLNGLGVTQNTQTALEYLSLAGELGIDSARRMSETLRADLRQDASLGPFK